MEGDEIANIGWPLGLGSMNSRIRVVAASEIVAPPPQSAASQFHRSTSFSSFSSSNLDTESTASFFPDQSVSLGRLIGIETTNKGRVIYNVADDERSHKQTHNTHGGICAPLLHHVFGRIGRSQATTRH